MLTTLEISHHAIRLVQCDKDGIHEIDTYPIAQGTDPISALGAVALPSPLGAVRVVMHHDDMLIGAMLQAPCPEERLQRLIEFEVSSNLGDSIDDSLVSWYVSPTGGSGDMRILTLVTRKTLIHALNEALRVHKGSVASLLHPAVGLFLAWQQQKSTPFNDARTPSDTDPAKHTGNVILIDCGGTMSHIALVEKNTLLFIRSCPIGMDALIQDISALRNIEHDAAQDMIAQLSTSMPDDIKHIIFRHASALANQITNVLRFAAAQLNMKHIESDHIVFSGAGARVPFLIDPIGRHLNIPTRVLNPFAGMVAQLPATHMDRCAELPSPLAPVFGICTHHDSNTLILDACAQLHREQKNFRETSGSLRIAAALCAALLVWAFIQQQSVISAHSGLLTQLNTKPTGLLTTAAEKNTQLAHIHSAHTHARQQLLFIDNERRPGRIVRELLATIAEIQHAETCPVALQSLHVQRTHSNTVHVTIHGRAQSTGSLSTDKVIRHFEEGLHQGFPFFERNNMRHIAANTQNTPAGYHPFAYSLTFQNERTHP